jgi:hypothetical protein
MITIELELTVNDEVETYASPSSSESFGLLLAFRPPDFFPLDFPETLLSGVAEPSPLIFIGASSSSSEEAPARARRSSSTSSMSAMIAEQILECAVRVKVKVKVKVSAKN